MSQSRTHNEQNEITSISGLSTPTYDANGNLTTDEEDREFIYDAWNRLVEVKTVGGETRDFFYSAMQQVLEERVDGDAVVSYVWSPVYVDAMISRDWDSDDNGSSPTREIHEGYRSQATGGVCGHKDKAEEMFKKTGDINPKLKALIGNEYKNFEFTQETLRRGNNWRRFITDEFTGTYGFSSAPVKKVERRRKPVRIGLRGAIEAADFGRRRAGSKRRNEREPGMARTADADSIGHQ